MTLEEMGSFFDTRSDGYEDHMRQFEGAADYAIIAGLVPATPGLKLLDLGCGTGLELDEIFKVNPDVQVTGFDLSGKMLERLRRKHAGRHRQLRLVQGDYLTSDFGTNLFDVAVSVQSLHHFSHGDKTDLYRKVYAALKPDGFYLESDYIASDQAEEDSRFAENERLRAEQGIAAGHYHYDTPCTVENQVSLLEAAGFRSVELLVRRTNSALLKAVK